MLLLLLLLLQVAALPTRQSVWVHQPWRFYDEVSVHLDACVALLHLDVTDAVLRLVSVEPKTTITSSNTSSSSSNNSSSSSNSCSSSSSSGGADGLGEGAYGVALQLLQRLDLLLQCVAGSRCLYTLLLSILRLKFLHSLLPAGNFRIALKKNTGSSSSSSSTSSPRVSHQQQLDALETGDTAPGAAVAATGWGGGLGGHFIPIESTRQQQQQQQQHAARRAAAELTPYGSTSEMSPASRGQSPRAAAAGCSRGGGRDTPETLSGREEVAPAAAASSSSRSNSSNGEGCAVACEAAWGTLRLLLYARSVSLFGETETADPQAPLAQFALHAAQ